MKVFGYIRTSTKKQLTDRQVLVLKDKCDKIFIENGVSAVKKRRPAYEKMIKQLQAGDMLIVSSLDRAFRSVIDALRELDKLHKRNIQFKSLSQNFDTTTAEGKLLYTIAAALAEWERKTISRRTKEGLSAARKRGKKLGRPHKLKKSDVINAQKQLANNSGVTLKSIAKDLSINPKTLSRSIQHLTEGKPWNHKTKKINTARN